MKSKQIAPLPEHIAFIMDGNGRWAKKRLMPRNYGHKAGVESLKKLAETVFAAGIPYMTVYAFSTENKFRPQEEVDGLIDLIRSRMRDLTEEIVSKGVRVRFLGDVGFFPSDVTAVLDDVRARSRDGKTGTLSIALNYGSRDEIVRAAEAAAKSGQTITAETLAAHLDTAGIPDPDLIVRTGGEMRLSNFLLYQAAYAELFFTDTLWPDFGEKELYTILEEFAGRNRRFGRVDK